jgi:peptide-methionine (S)-S-oxide reductase
MELSLALATFGGGCFWCLEASFEQLNGVNQVVSGYAAGHTTNPRYEDVSRGITGHAEVVQVHYDPEKISYATLLEVFFTIHDPTSLNRQGNDIGTQYRSIILTHNEQQKLQALAAINSIAQSKRYSQAIVTQVQALEQFYLAEDYHQDYFAKNPSKAYCQLVVKPKVEKVNETFKSLIK